MKRILLRSFMLFTLVCSSFAQTHPVVTWDRHGLMMNGKRLVPVMGEIHYSRLPKEEWQEEIHKMKEGGVTIIATYCFWNHIEEQEDVFDWTGQRDLRTFLELCKTEGLPVILRVGPFCHGEVRNGGIPDWMFTKGCRMRSEDPVFLQEVKRLYEAVYSQVKGLQWKDGGPLMAVQFDNEYRGKGSYLMTLKKIANDIGFDLPFYTRTGWPELSTPIPFGEMIPLYGDYADGFWERSLEETAGNYYKAFHFKAFRSSTAIATEQFGEQKEELSEDEELYPYFTCELGGGMMTSYHRRVFIYPEDAYSMAVVKLGSGSNLLGYYMYHGGTNPDGKLTTLQETQRTPATNYNDMPVKSYDFQAPIGEFGQLNSHYFMLRKLHLFMKDFGDVLAPMEAVFPVDNMPQDKGVDSYLRWCYRTDGIGAFVFINNYERLQNLTEKENVQFDVCGEIFPSTPLTIPKNAICVFPVHVSGIRYATAQLIAKRDGNIYLEQIAGIPTEIAVGTHVMRNVEPKGKKHPVYKNIYLLTSEEAGKLFWEGKEFHDVERSETSLVKKMKNLWIEGNQDSLQRKSFRTISIGVNKVAEEPSDEDFEHYSHYLKIIEIDDWMKDKLMEINYSGDCARLYADGKLVADNFYNGHPFLFGLWRLPAGTNQLELRIIPKQPDMPVYFPKEAIEKDLKINFLSNK